jgi:hypothetical protein
VSKLTERALVKDILQIPRADQRQDPLLDSLIEAASAETERICNRKFAYRENIVETWPSFDQSFADPEPQFHIVDSFPMSTSVPQIQWSPYDQRPNLVVYLSYDTGDFAFNPETGLISIRYMGVAATNLPFVGGIMFTYHPRGFQITYSGGYPTTAPPSPNDNPDPLDDYGVTDVPVALKLIVAQKAAEDFRALRPPPRPERAVSRPLQDLATQRLAERLIPWRKRDRMF